MISITALTYSDDIFRLAALLRIDRAMLPLLNIRILLSILEIMIIPAIVAPSNDSSSGVCVSDDNDSRTALADDESISELLTTVLRLDSNANRVAAHL
jgi:hypothetical protein